MFKLRLTKGWKSELNNEETNFQLIRLVKSLFLKTFSDYNMQCTFKYHLNVYYKVKTDVSLSFQFCFNCLFRL